MENDKPYAFYAWNEATNSYIYTNSEQDARQFDGAPEVVDDGPPEVVDDGPPDCCISGTRILSFHCESASGAHQPWERFV